MLSLLLGAYRLLSVSQCVVRGLVGKDVIRGLRVVILRNGRAVVLVLLLIVLLQLLLLDLGLGPDVLSLLVMRDAFQLGLVLLDLLLEQHLVRLDLVKLLLHVMQVIRVLMLVVLLRTAANCVSISVVIGVARLLALLIAVVVAIMLTACGVQASALAPACSARVLHLLTRALGLLGGQAGSRVEIEILLS